jgi:5-methylcytosine-specific restriction endonuclease McrBC GTP-binding regulatory subunit McrB
MFQKESESLKKASNYLNISLKFPHTLKKKPCILKKNPSGICRIATMVQTLGSIAKID